MASSKSGTLGLPVLAPQTGAHIAGNASGGGPGCEKVHQNGPGSSTGRVFGWV